MSTSSIIPRDDTNKLVLLQQLNAQLSNYASALDITVSDLTQLKVGLDWFDYSLKAQETTQNYSHALVALKNTLRDGPKSTAINLPSPPLFTPTPFIRSGNCAFKPGLSLMTLASLNLCPIMVSVQLLPRLFD